LDCRPRWCWWRPCSTARQARPLRPGRRWRNGAVVRDVPGEHRPTVGGPESAPRVLDSERGQRVRDAVNMASSSATLTRSDHAARRPPVSTAPPPVCRAAARAPRPLVGPESRAPLARPACHSRPRRCARAPRAATTEIASRTAFKGGQVRKLDAGNGTPIQQPREVAWPSSTTSPGDSWSGQLILEPAD
jgi:hypothetical protein